MEQFHNYHPETFEYLSSKPMKYSPLDNEPAPPAFSTVIPLPVLVANEAAVFDEQNNAWTVVPDFRGVTYYKKVDGAEVNFKLGESPDSTVQKTIPADVILKRSKKLKVAELYQACSLHITGGVISNALGAAYTYPMSERDQNNLNAVVTESIINASDNTWAVPFWCADANGIWDRRIHTQVQIQQAGQDAAVHVRNAQDKLKSLVDQVNDSLTDTETKINAIVW